MRFFSLLLILFFFSHCSKPKTVLICGDHVCVNKAEAEQFFERNLSIEVKIINQKDEPKIDLVELNLNNNIDGERKVKVFKKNETNNKLKDLSKDEIKNIKKKIKNKNKKKELAKKILKKDDVKKEREVKKAKIIDIRDSKILKNNVDKSQKEIVDVCTIIKKCNIEDITKYLLNVYEDKGFPDITRR